MDTYAAVWVRGSRQRSNILKKPKALAAKQPKNKAITTTNPNQVATRAPRAPNNLPGRGEMKRPRALSESAMGERQYIKA
ncbi:MAG: hypothetical protein JWN24_3219 [Phycisphaerales bacterium]|nr:hypothetical protein [Phycisphaerales bacterium]